MIARKAGVSIPTVYKYFPTFDHLIPACTGLVAGRAPIRLGPEIFEGKGRIADRVRALACSVFRLHEYFSPWARWSESDAAASPALRSFLEQARMARRELTRQALTVPGARPPTEEFLLLSQILLEYPCWKMLTSSGKTSDRAAAIVADAILSLVRSYHPLKETS
jgi:AcrR family transcriptional regulator